MDVRESMNLETIIVFCCYCFKSRSITTQGRGDSSFKYKSLQFKKVSQVCLLQKLYGLCEWCGFYLSNLPVVPCSPNTLLVTVKHRF